MKRYKTPREYLVFLLSRREYSINELTEKGFKYFPEQHQTISELITKFEQEGLVSDDRFCESFIRHEVRRGSGRQKIIQRLLQKGINLETAKFKCAELIDQDEILESAQYLADKKRLQIKRKKPGITDYELRGKLTQFLAGRGFDFDIISQVVNNQSSDE